MTQIYKCYESCGTCCPQEGNIVAVSVTLKDIGRLARNSLLHREGARDFLGWYLREDSGELYFAPMLSNPCPYFNADKRCDIFERSPTECRIYPQADMAVDEAPSRIFFECAYGKTLGEKEIGRYRAEREQVLKDIADTISYFGKAEIVDPKFEEILRSLNEIGILLLDQVIEAATILSNESAVSLTGQKAAVQAKLEERIAAMQSSAKQLGAVRS